MQVPHTTYRTESYSCGFGKSYSSCTRSVPSTSYRSETRYRTAHRTAYRTAYRTEYRTAYRTAWRTAYRTAWRNVTKTRLEPRMFQYSAIERVGFYSGTWRLAIALGGAGPLDVVLADSLHQVGYDHDVTFTPAGVAPSRAQLMTVDAWFLRLLAQLSGVVPARLTQHWSTSFCQMPSFDAETAARCGYGATMPAPARGQLARLFGVDVDRVIARFVGAPLPNSAR